MASLAARSVFRSCSNSARKASAAAARVGSQSRAAPSPFRMASNKPIASPTFRFPAEMSFCLESMLPLHSVTSSALMTSMLSIASYDRLPEACKKRI